MKKIIVITVVFALLGFLSGCKTTVSYFPESGEIHYVREGPIEAKGVLVILQDGTHIEIESTKSDATYIIQKMIEMGIEMGIEIGKAAK